MRAPDIYFVRTERLPDGRVLVHFFDFALDLAVEIISPPESAEEVQAKVRDYFAAGTSLILLVYPRTRILVAHAPDGSARNYGEDETFADDTVLPGFSCRVADILA